MKARMKGFAVGRVIAYKAEQAKHMAMVPEFDAAIYAIPLRDLPDGGASHGPTHGTLLRPPNTS